MVKNKLTKEWFLPAQWGKIALISWGQPHNPPILLVHGIVDSAATFIPLVESLPDSYYYVSFDFPGHGKSDPVYSGPLVTQNLILESMRLIVEHMKWKSFVFLAHSMGFMTGLIYQHLFPGQITKMINVDPLFTLAQYYHLSHNFPFFYALFYEHYFEHYDVYLSTTQPKLHEYDKVIKAAMDIRGLTREQTELALSRSLIPAKNGLYRLTTQPVMRRIVQYSLEEDILRHIIQEPTTPSMLNFNVLGDLHMSEEEREFLSSLGLESKENIKSLYFHGKHDLHIFCPELLVSHILEFLNENETVKSKL